MIIPERRKQRKHHQNEVIVATQKRFIAILSDLTGAQRDFPTTFHDTENGDTHDE